MVVSPKHMPEYILKSYQIVYSELFKYACDITSSPY